MSNNNEHSMNDKPIFKPLVYHLLFNAILMTCFAWLHPFVSQQMPKGSLGLDNVRVFELVFVESILIGLPALLTGGLISHFLPKTGKVTGHLLIAATPIIYYADLMTHIIIGSRLFSHKTYDVIVLFLPWLSELITNTNFVPLFIYGAIYLFVQLLLIWVSRKIKLTQKLTNKKTGTIRFQRTRKTVLLAFCLSLFIPLFTLMKAPSEVLKVMQEMPDRHPINVTGLVEQVMIALQEPHQQNELLLSIHLAQMQPVFEKHTTLRKTLQLVQQPVTTPDILIVMSESLQHHAFNTKSAPHISRLASQSIQSQLHFSGGNATEFGFYAILSGQDAYFFDTDPTKNPMVLPKLLKQAGYHCAFIGNGVGSPAEKMSIYGSEFVNKSAFDYFYLSSRDASGASFDFLEDDHHVAMKTDQVFSRKGEFKHLEKKPICVFLYLYSTHYEYYSSKEDQVYLPTIPNDIPVLPFNVNKLDKIKNRYKNSVHALDRILAPLLEDKNRIVAIAGDHGESFGEDGHYLHATQLSFIQTRTPLVFHVPGHAPRELAGPTQHQDILPTILDAIGAKVNSPHLLSGRSLLSSKPLDDRVLLLRGHVTNNMMMLDSHRENLSPYLLFQMNQSDATFSFVKMMDDVAKPIPWTNKDLNAFNTTYQHWLKQQFSEEIPPVPETIFPVLTDALKSPHKKTQLLAVEVCRKLKREDARKIFPILRQFQQSRDETLKNRAKDVFLELLKK